jgi:multidrug efflux pump subunit AcrA (membrane-fusion protein)
MAAALGAAGCGAKSANGASAGTVADQSNTATLNAADIAVARLQTLRAGIPLSGALEAKVKITVGAPLAEQLLEVYVNEGDRVRQGQPLARFKDQVLQAAAAYARADVQSQRMAVRVAEAESARNQLMLRLPNLPHESVPVGKSAADNPVVRVSGEKPCSQQQTSVQCYARPLQNGQVVRPAKRLQ